MRWRFIDPTNRPEVVSRNAIIARIDAWWGEFQARTDDLSALFSQKAKWDLPGWMHRHLGAIDPKLMWEFGPGVKQDGHRLVITPESAHHLRPLVRTILDRAPALEHWEFYEYRLAEDLEEASRMVEARAEASLAAFTFQASLGDHQRINLNFTSPSISDPKDQKALHAAFVATETLLGEEYLNHWIGAIELAPGRLPKSLFSWREQVTTKPPGFYRLDRLKETVEALIGSIQDQLPPQPHFERAEEAKWTLWEMKPVPADDYPGQLDMFVGKSMNPTMWKAARSDVIFCSERFSRCGESFIYAKIERSNDEEPSAGSFADKGEIEDALDEALRLRKLGCQIGGGAGCRYFYVDLALTDLKAGIEVVRECLRAGNVSKRSWILFHHTELAAEWVGIYDDSPPPPFDLDDQ